MLDEIITAATKPAENRYTGLTKLPGDTAVTMAYVPFQLDTCRYDDSEALCKGTLYPALDKPFMRGAVR